MLEGKLEKDTIAQPDLWRLVLMVSDSSLSVALYPPVAREEIIWRRFEFDPSTPDRLRAIEDVVYDNPLLLCDFKRVDCIIDSRSYLILPPELSVEDNQVLMDSSGMKFDIDSAIVTQLTNNAMIVQAFDSNVVSFLKRTFYNIEFSSKISVLTKYFLSHDLNHSGRRAFALADATRLTFIAFDSLKLLAANEFDYRKATDAAYYILASMQQLGLDPQDSEITLSTHRDLSDDDASLQSLLKPYVKTLRTVSFPTLRYRATRSTLQIPFPLLVLPICE